MRLPLSLPRTEGAPHLARFCEMWDFRDSSRQEFMFCSEFEVQSWVPAVCGPKRKGFACAKPGPSKDYSEF
jgi:hypothetical protein